MAEAGRRRSRAASTKRTARRAKRDEPDVADDPIHRDALALAEQSAGIGVWTIDLKTQLVRGTAQFFRIMGLAPTDDRVPVETIRALRHPADRERVLAGFRHALEGGSDAYEIEYRIVRPDGQLRWIFGRGRVVRDPAGVPVRYSGVDLDITDRKIVQAELDAAKEALERMNQVLEQRMLERTAALEVEAERRAQAEARLHQAQKMEAVGQLTGGVAHDFNNILQIILGNLQIGSLMLARDTADAHSIAGADGVRDAIAKAQRAAQSAKQLVHRLLAFSRMQTLDPAVLDPNALIAGMSDMIRRTLGETIRVDTTLAADAWPAFADRNQLETALLNLVVNARDAMPRGGRLTIQTSNVTVGDASTDDIARGDYVIIAVRDTGVGIPPELVDKVFEPFFTTKETGKGSGLGLSMVYGFVKQSGGHVRIQSAPDAGTTVRLYLPRAAHAGVPAGIEALSAMPLPPATSIHALARARPGETVLLVEDNDDVRRFGVSALEGLGYRVLDAPDGHAALKLLDASPSPVHLLFTDVVLPGGMTGTDLAAAIRRRRPDIAVLYTSGYTRNPIHHASVTDAGVLAKPYPLESLAMAIRRTMDRSPRSDLD